MSPIAEKRGLQAAMALVLVLPFTAAIAGVVAGPRFLGHPPLVPTDLDSHFRYVNGIFLAMLIGYVSCIPAIERRGARLELLLLLTMSGGAMRLLSLLTIGPPSKGHLAGLVIELVIAPALFLWQTRVAARYSTPASPGRTSAVAR